jgi:pimeloyl-ACP methyl ester carboxylesterase
MAEFVATADGVRLAYDTAGRGEPPVVFVHGWGGDRSYFAPQVTHFADRHAVATLDLRGHGESGRPEPGRPGSYEVAAFADDALAVAKAGRLAPPRRGRPQPGRLARVGMRSAPWCGAGGGHGQPALALSESAKAFFAASVEAVAADRDGAWRAGFISEQLLPTDTVRRQEIIAGVAALPAAIAAAAWRAIARFDGAVALGQVQVPLLWIGSDDPGAALREACPRIIIGQTVGAGHFNQLEVPDQVNAMIERFLAVIER